MTDQASITVIATGLEDVSANMVTPQKAAAQGGMAANMQGHMTYPNQMGQRPGAGMTTPNTVTNGLHTTANGLHTTGIQQASAPQTYSGIQRPRQPESTVKPVEINIPDFLKNSRR